MTKICPFDVSITEALFLTLIFTSFKIEKNLTTHLIDTVRPTLLPNKLMHFFLNSERKVLEKKENKRLLLSFSC